jgi:tetratricopeptide (TPR) repeat protein
VCTNRLELDRAIDHARQALDLADQLADGRVQAAAMDSLLVAAVMIGDFGTVETIAPRLVEIHRSHGDLWYLQFALYQWCWVSIAAGRWAQAHSRLEEALRVNQRVGDHGNEPMYLATYCQIDRSRGRYEQALASGRQAVALARELGHLEWTAWSEIWLGSTLQDLYALREAAEHFERGLEAGERVGALNHAIPCAGHLAWVHWLSGDVERALSLTDRAGYLLGRITTPPDTAFLQGAHGTVAVARVHLGHGAPARAAALLAPVLAAAEACNWQEVIAEASLVMGQCHAVLGDRRSAEDRLCLALGVAFTIGLRGVEWQAHAALAKFYRAGNRHDDGDRHLKQGRAILDELAATIADPSVRRNFMTGALPNLETTH